MDQQSTALLYGFWARTSGADREREKQADTVELERKPTLKRPQFGGKPNYSAFLLFQLEVQ